MHNKSYIIYSLRLIFAMGVCSTLIACASLKQPKQEYIQEKTIQSTIVFEGTISHLGETTVATVSASPHTAVVKVRKIFKGPNFFESFIDKQVTVLVKDLSGLKKNSNAVFFTTGWIIGKNVALREVGRIEKYDTDSLSSRINAISRFQSLKPIETNIRKAQIVLAGKVTEVHDIKTNLKLRIPGKYISEHAPQWKLAVIQPTAILKGDHQIKRIEVLFPSSTDVAWYYIPKLAVDQQGIWVLKMDANLKMYAIKQRHDFLPIEQLNQVKSIINRIQ